VTETTGSGSTPPTNTSVTGGASAPGGAPGEPTARQYLLDLHYGQGIPYAEISRRLGRSTRLLRFVATGQKPGRNLTEALREFATTGQVTAEPQRRTTAAGGRARIRAQRGTPSIVPPPPRQAPQPARRPSPPAPTRPPTTGPSRSAARSAQQPDFTVRDPETRNTFRQLSDINPNTQRGNHSLQAPKARWSYGRWAANNAFAQIARDAATLGQRLHAAIHVEIGTGPNKRRLPPIKLGGKGGYDAGNVSTAITAEGGDAFGWLATQIEGRYPEFEAEQWTVIAVDVDVW
jgi:hypothetical protein